MKDVLKPQRKIGTLQEQKNGQENKKVNVTIPPREKKGSNAKGTKSLKCPSQTQPLAQSPPCQREA